MTFLESGRPRAGGLSDEVVSLGDVRRPAGGLCVRRSGGREIAVELVKVGADRMPPVSVAEHLAQPVGLAQPRAGAQRVADRDRAARHGERSRSQLLDMQALISLRSLGATS